MHALQSSVAATPPLPYCTFFPTRQGKRPYLSVPEYLLITVEQGTYVGVGICLDVNKRQLSKINLLGICSTPINFSCFCFCCSFPPPLASAPSATQAQVQVQVKCSESSCVVLFLSSS
ncbi:hypothetical protein ACHAXM_001889 [Skeletonema potamos]